MIVDTEKRTLQTNTNNQSRKFGIGNAAMAISIARDKMYAYPVRSLVQEYICNARDAMRQNGTWGVKPMRIGLPNRINPVFSVRDFGNSIPDDMIYNVYIQFYVSTKSLDDTMTGGFGLGSKSGFSYTDSFTVITYIDGVKRTYLMHLGDSEEGSCEMLSLEQTNEENGTEVLIPVEMKDLNYFRDCVHRCTFSWKEPIEYVGAEPIEKPSVLFENDDIIVFHPTSTFEINAVNKGYALIDGVPYPWDAPWHVCQQINSSLFLFKFKTGELKPTPSRETISTKNLNQAIIDAKYKSLADLSNEKKTEAEALKSIEEVVAYQKQWGWLRSVRDCSVDLGGNFYYGSGNLYTRTQGLWTLYRVSSRRSRNLKEYACTFVSLHSPNIILRDVQLKKGDFGRRIKQYANVNGGVVVMDSLPPCVPDIQHVKLSSIPFVPAPKVNRAPRDYVSPEHVQIAYRNGDWISYKAATTLPGANEKVAYLLKRDSLTETKQHYIVKAGYQLLRVTLVGEKQIKKRYPNLKDARQVWEDEAILLAKEDAKVRIDITLQMLTKSVLAKEIEAIQPDRAPTYSDNLRYLFDNDQEVKAAHDKHKKLAKALLDKYPLLDHITNIEDNIKEINFYIKSKQENK